MEQLAIGLAIAGMLAAVFFTVVPVLPGTLFVLAGAVGYGLADSFEPFAWWFWVGQVVLAAIYLAVDNIAQVFGVQRAGGSKQAMIGGTVGVFAGPLLLAPLTGPFALLFGPPLGAVAGSIIGELRHRRRLEASDTPAVAGGSLKAVGWGAAMAYLIGMIAKLTVLLVQLVWLGVLVF